MAYSIEFTPQAARQLRRLARPIQQRLLTCIESLAGDPRQAGVKKLSDPESLFRIREGDYRVIYQIEDDVLRVLVVGMGHRKDIYKWLQRRRWYGERASYAKLNAHSFMHDLTGGILSKVLEGEVEELLRAVVSRAALENNSGRVWFSLPLRIFDWYPVADSNGRTWLRRPALYPLS